MRLCWADKTALGFFALITLVILFLGLGPTPEAYRNVTEAQRWAAFAEIEWILFLKIGAPVWIALRAADLVAGGPGRRRAQREANARQASAKRIDLSPAEWTRAEPDWRRQLRQLGR